MISPYPPVCDCDRKNPTPGPIGPKENGKKKKKKVSITRPDPIYWLVVAAIPVSDSLCHESQKRHYRFQHGPLTRFDSCKSTGLSAEGTDGERVRCHHSWSCLRRAVRRTYGVEQTIWRELSTITYGWSTVYPYPLFRMHRVQKSTTV